MERRKTAFPFFLISQKTLWKKLKEESCTFHILRPGMYSVLDSLAVPFSRQRRLHCYVNEPACLFANVNHCFLLYWACDRPTSCLGSQPRGRNFTLAVFSRSPTRFHVTGIAATLGRTAHTGQQQDWESGEVVTSSSPSDHEPLKCHKSLLVNWHNWTISIQLEKKTHSLQKYLKN